MGAQEIITLVLAVLASPLLVKLVEVISLKINKKETQLDRIENNITETINKITKIKTELDSVKMDQMRTNILLLLTDYEDSTDIPWLAKSYVDHGGDSYVIPLIVNWYSKKELAIPEWLKKAYDEHCTYSLDTEE